MKNSSVLQKMELIQSIFREVQDSFDENKSVGKLVASLDGYNVEFRSIAYESASMCIAIDDYEKYNELKFWFSFLNQNQEKHATQIHIGLGWALAQKEINPEPLLKKFEPMMRYRVLDGYGYYEGIFRRRKSILNQQKPDFIDKTAASAYDQGLGRSIWYLNNGDITLAKNMIQKFPAERHADFWRGLGIAITYVGGCDEKYLQEIFTAAENYQPNLAAGAMMGFVSRHYAGLDTEGSILAAEVLTHQSKDHILKLNEQLRTDLDVQNVNTYRMWIDGMELHFNS